MTRPIVMRLASGGPVIVLLVLLALLSLIVPDFFGIRNFRGLIMSVSLVGTVAAAAMLVLALGEVDLSVGSTTAFAGVVCAAAMTATGSVGMGILIGLVAASAIGLANGVVVAKFGVNSLIATLAMMEIVRGAAYLVAGGDVVLIPFEKFYALGSGTFLGIGWPVWIAIAAFAAGGVLLRFTVLGRNILAVGGNAAAARLAGVPVQGVKLFVFTLQGFIAGLAGIVLASRITSGQPSTSQGLELAVISACVLGGASLTGGVAPIVGVMVGVLILGAAQNALNLLDVPTFYQFVVRGGILLAAVLVDRYRPSLSKAGHA